MSRELNIESGFDRRHDPRSVRRGGFTLTELLVAIAVLVGILLAAGSIFSTTSKVAAVGKAGADVLQDTAAVGRQLRDDLASLSREGVFAIRSVSVPNDINGTALLDPNRPRTDVIRSDQLLFFVDGSHGMSTFRPGRRSFQRAQAAIARVYYGHAFQFGEAGQAADHAPTLVRGHDPAPGAVVYPWTSSAVDGTIATVRTIYDGAPGGNTIFTNGSPGNVRVTPPESRRWLMVRQAVPLMDDDTGPVSGNDEALFLEDALAARSVFLGDPYLGLTPQLRDGRVDAAVTQLNDIRHRIEYLPNGNWRPWRGGASGAGDQFAVISGGLLYYPRAERSAPSMNRIDQALTRNVIIAGCSSVRIEWTYAEGTGYVAEDGNGNELLGVRMPATGEQPWFGLPDGAPGVATYTGHSGDGLGAATIFPANVEALPAGGASSVRVYEAVFGYNQTFPLDADGLANPSIGHTPWPSAIRITLTLHDAKARLEGGREVQFVLDLPRAPQ